MAGSGKTTLMQRLHADLDSASSPFYSINLDPAVRNLPYEPDIDVRETVNYKGVMKQYQLGPNGGILTALNLFATKFDQVPISCASLFHYLPRIHTLRATPPAHVLVDTPGQIEIFTWSASGAVIAESLASSFPTCILYVVDTPRSARPVTFMSNMLYACSILYKFRLPLVLVFNKTDVLSADFASEWMADSEAFQQALEQEKAYIGSLSRSMSLMLDEFYSQLRAVHVSALTGEGIPALFEALQGCKDEYNETYANAIISP
ncbi:GPN-loop GTPase [Pavlovales sp. CCMP2436]|nr:GPN-loop GTPase [Pavlovales sp. CCMP2436]